ncbi:hypothetical protein V2V90_23945 (plasmid) [Agrobacterium leguminum]|uniref:hypothetical protein n=1 Tax=Agrobacterium leguminum TaxID=2792015 RepID=UPI0030CCE5C3
MSNEAATESATAPKRMGRPSVVADAIPLFVEAVRAVEEGYEELWSKEWDERIAGKAISTRAAYVSKYRTAIEDALGSLHPSLLHIKVLDRTESEEQRRTYTSRSNAGRPGTRREAIETFVRHAKLLNDARHSAVKSGRKPNGRLMRSTSARSRSFGTLRLESGAETSNRARSFPPQPAIETRCGKPPSRMTSHSR